MDGVKVGGVVVGGGSVVGVVAGTELVVGDDVDVVAGAVVVGARVVNGTVVVVVDGVVDELGVLVVVVAGTVVVVDGGTSVVVVGGGGQSVVGGRSRVIVRVWFVGPLGRQSDRTVIVTVASSAGNGPIGNGPYGVSSGCQEDSPDQGPESIRCSLRHSLSRSASAVAVKVPVHSASGPHGRSVVPVMLGWCAIAMLGATVNARTARMPPMMIRFMMSFRVFNGILLHSG